MQAGMVSCRVSRAAGWPGDGKQSGNRRMKKSPIRPNRIDSYVNQWLSAWMGFLFLGMLGVIIATALLGGMYAKGIAHLQYVSDRSGWHADTRMDGIAVHLRNFTESIEDLERRRPDIESDPPELQPEVDRFDKDQLIERLNSLLRAEEFNSGFAGQIKVAWPTPDGSQILYRTSDRNADGFFEAGTGELVQTPVKPPLVREKVWKQLRTLDEQGLESVWMTYSIRFFENDDTPGICTVSIPIQDLTDRIREDMDHSTLGWLMVDVESGTAVGDVSRLSTDSLEEAADWLEKNHAILASQKGYAQLRTERFGQTCYVFRSTILSHWNYYCIVSSSSLFGREILTMQLLGAGMGIILLVSLISGILFSKRVTRGLVRLTGRVAATMNGESFQPVEETDSYEIHTLSEAFGKALRNLEEKNNQLLEESARTNRMSAEISRFYSHMRLLNENGFRIDLFDYLPEKGLMRFHTGLVTLYGAGSKIYRELLLTEFFDHFDIQPGREEFLRRLQEAATEGVLDMRLQATAVDGKSVCLRCRIGVGEPAGVGGRTSPRVMREIPGVLVDMEAE